MRCPNLSQSYRPSLSPSHHASLSDGVVACTSESISHVFSHETKMGEGRTQGNSERSVLTILDALTKTAGRKPYGGPEEEADN